MKTKISPSWLAVMIILWIIAVASILEKQIVSCLFFLGASFWILYSKWNIYPAEQDTSSEEKNSTRRRTAADELA